MACRVSFLTALAMLICVALLVVPDQAVANRRRRRSARRGLRKGGNVFSWTCAGDKLDRFLDRSSGLDIVNQACTKAGKKKEKKLACFMVSAQLPSVSIAVDVLCGRKGWNKATFASSNIELGDASTAQIVLEGISANDVDGDDMKQRIVDELNRIAGANIFGVKDIFIHKIEDGSAAAIVSFSVVTDAAFENCYTANLINNLENRLDNEGDGGMVTATTFVNCANCVPLGARLCPATTSTTTTVSISPNLNCLYAYLS